MPTSFAPRAAICSISKSTLPGWTMPRRRSNRSQALTCFAAAFRMRLVCECIVNSLLTRIDSRTSQPNCSLFSSEGHSSGVRPLGLTAPCKSAMKPRSRGCHWRVWLLRLAFIRCMWRAVFAASWDIHSAIIWPKPEFARPSDSFSIRRLRSWTWRTLVVSRTTHICAGHSNGQPVSLLPLFAGTFNSHCERHNK